MRALAAHLHLHATSGATRKIWDDKTFSFVEHKVQIASPLYDKDGKPITKPLGAEIQVGIGDSALFHTGKYRACANGAHIASFSSLHRAKNAIRRHFGIESRKMLRWEEVSR